MTSFTHVVAEVKRRGLVLQYDPIFGGHLIKENGVIIWHGDLSDALAFLSEWDDLVDGGFDE